MKTSRILSSRWLSFLLPLTLVAIALAPGRASADDVPRYKLSVGDELTYRTAEGPSDEKQNPRRAESEWVLTVVEQNPEGGWRVLFREKTSYGSSYTRTSAGYFDLKPDGRIAENRTINVHANPTSLFPVLPPDADAIKNGWSSAMPIDETKCSYTAPDGPPSPDAETWTFEEDIDNVFTPIYEITRHCTNEFDVKRGIVRKLTSTSKQGWPKSQEERVHQGVMEFAEQRTIESPELTSLDKEMMRYFDVCAAYDDVMEKADFTNMKETLGEAEGVLKQAQGTFNVPAVEAMIEKKLDDFNQSRAYELENAERFGKLIGKPSEDWKTEDLAGHPRSLEDYKGKVVLLDFWYRGCGWCIRAMPQLKQLSDEFPKDKVAVIGMNNDRHQEDAQLVIEKMGLNYETLKNGSFDDGIHSKYGVQGWPTLVVLDGQGVVRDVHVGYSPNLRKELGDKIRKLLGEKVAEN